ncbi:hypothetical protein EJB05_41885, partial [Eragrostis curvula]
MAIPHRLVVVSCIILLAASSASSPPPAAAIRGDEGVVMVPAPPAGDSGGETLDEWSLRRGFLVGDVLDFKNWNGSVNMILDGDFQRCAAASPLHRITHGNTTRVRLHVPGTLYFIGASPARCQAGERMAVLVRASDEGMVKVASTPAKGSGGETPNQRATTHRVDVPGDYRPLRLMILRFADHAW